RLNVHLIFSSIVAASFLIGKKLTQINIRLLEVIGSPQPILAIVGDDIILPCHLRPAMDAASKTVEWTRPDLKPRFVHVWHSGKELVHAQHPSYEGRTSLFINELKNGNVSLKLSKVRLSDKGKYRCFLPLSDIHSTVELVALQLQRLQLMANHHIRYAKSGVDLQCKSEGWYPEPEVLWLDGEGNLFSAGSTEIIRGPNDLYTISSRVTVERRHNNIKSPIQKKHGLISLPLGHSQVIGSSQPIVAIAGDDVILPCQLEPAVDAREMTVEWARPDLKPKYVFLRRDGTELQRDKHPMYKGRTSLSEDKLRCGDISLKLTEVKLSDSGAYRCLVLGTNKEYVIKLTAGSVSLPTVSISKASSGVDLQCKSEGWYPEPEVLWLDGDGNLLSAGSTEIIRGPNNLYTVSSRVTVERRHNNMFTCRIKEDLEKRKTIHDDMLKNTETHLDSTDALINTMTERKGKLENDKEQETERKREDVQIEEIQRQRDERRGGK
uniref:Ig-like domain-containing protein n=1 Tax=Labrus bergylta TaxID=56723 RepID=A0A3Q3FN24_9LABR